MKTFSSRLRLWLCAQFNQKHCLEVDVYVMVKILIKNLNYLRPESFLFTGKDPPSCVLGRKVVSGFGRRYWLSFSFLDFMFPWWNCLGYCTHKLYSATWGIAQPFTMLCYFLVNVYVMTQSCLMIRGLVLEVNIRYIAIVIIATILELGCLSALG